MSKPSWVIILAEDRRQQTFVRRYLQRAGYSPGQIKLEALPGDKGSGEQWVRLLYAKNFEAYRSRMTRAATALIVVIDADTGSVSRRIEQLGIALADAGSTRLSREEKIAHLIPKRNIETWIVCLSGVHADENIDYKQPQNVPVELKPIDEHIKPAAARFFEWTRPRAAFPGYCVDSLRQAIPEVQRLK